MFDSADVWGHPSDAESDEIDELEAAEAETAASGTRPDE